MIRSAALSTESYIVVDRCALISVGITDASTTRRLVVSYDTCNCALTMHEHFQKNLEIIELPTEATCSITAVPTECAMDWNLALVCIFYGVSVPSCESLITEEPGESLSSEEKAEDRPHERVDGLGH